MNIFTKIKRKAGDILYLTKNVVIPDEDCKDRDTMLYKIINRYHVIEKGMTMPSARMGFGKEALKHLINDTSDYISKFGIDHSQISVAINVIWEYKFWHESKDFALESDILCLIDEFLAKHNVKGSFKQLEFDYNDFYKDIETSFPLFARSRHSVRHFDETQKISEDDLQSALELSLTSPSACNRQSVGVKLINNKDIISSVLKLQKGNRGFGHLAEKLIIVTTNMQAWSRSTLPGGYVDGGIYAMNLLYCLHYYKIATCPLNAYLTSEQQMELRKIIEMKESEVPIMFILLGKAPSTFKVVHSQRNRLDEILKVIE